MTPLWIIGVVALFVIGIAAATRGIWLISQRESNDARDPRRQEANEIRAAEKTLKRATEAYDKAVKKARQRRDAALAAKVLGVYGGIRLTEESVITPSGTARLGAGIAASVDSAGGIAVKSRSTLTRMGVGTVLAPGIGTLIGATAKKSKKVDDRELYLAVETPSFASVVACGPDDGVKVRQLAAAINTAARNAEQLAETRQERIAQAAADLAKTEADRSAIESAQRELDSTRARWGVDRDEPRP